MAEVEAQPDSIQSASTMEPNPFELPEEPNAPAADNSPAHTGPVTLRGLKINDLRHLAKSNGMEANGTKEQLKQALVDANIGVFE